MRKEGRRVVTRGCVGGNESYCLMGIELQFYKDEKNYRDRKRSWLHNNVNILNTTVRV